MNREWAEIQNQIGAEIDTTEIVFLQQALSMLKTKEEHINIKFDEPKVTEVEETHDAVPTVYEKQEINQNKLDWFDVNEEGAACIETIRDNMVELDLNAVDSNLNPDAPSFEIDKMQPEEFPLLECTPQETEQIEDNSVTNIDKLNQEKYFYFYQAEDGQQVFLNSLNVRILNASWGALAAAPRHIVGRVLHRETFSLTEQVSQKCSLSNQQYIFFLNVPFIK